jgi:hypothetical protein
MFRVRPPTSTAYPMRNRCWLSRATGLLVRKAQTLKDNSNERETLEHFDPLFDVNSSFSSVISIVAH